MRRLLCKMFAMTQPIPIKPTPGTDHQTPGGYLVQYTDDAIGQKAKLDEALCNRVEEAMRVIAAVNPYHHGVEQWNIRDRRRITIERASVLFIVSEQVKVLTVVNIETGSEPSDTSGGFPSPFVPGFSSSVPGPFTGFGDDDEFEEADATRRLLPVPA